MTAIRRLGLDVARSLCALHQQSDDEPREPLGLCAWEVPLLRHLPKGAWRGLWSSPGEECRLLYQADPERLHRDEAGAPLYRPRPTAPLSVWATPHGLRLLYLCAPGEALPLGRRLRARLQARLGDVGGADLALREAPPAVLADLCGRLLQRDPGLRLLGSPDGVLDPDQRRLHDWVAPWPVERLVGPRLSLAPASGGDAGPRLLGVQPTLLCPVALLVGPPDRDESALQEIVRDRALWRRMFQGSPYSLCLSHISPLMVTLLLPLRADNWRTLLYFLRDSISARLGFLAGWFHPLPESCAELLLDLSHLSPRLLGAEGLRALSHLPTAPPSELDLTLLGALSAALEVELGPKSLQLASGASVG